MKILRYSEKNQPAWDEFVRLSINGTFLFQRGYMDYHADQFSDHSLVFMGDDGRIQALLPGHVSGSTYSSHAGLTYGGLIYNENLKLEDMLAVWGELIAYLRQQSMERLVYKAVPAIYHRVPAGQDTHALLLAGGRIQKTTATFCINRRQPAPYRKTRLQSIKKGQKQGVVAAESADLDGFWSILTDRLESRYDAAPVHSLEEIRLLKSRFPENIRLYCAFFNGEMAAGVMVYQTEQVGKVQYIASSEQGRQCSAVDCAIDHLLQPGVTGGEWLDLGSAEMDGGAALNRGLVEQKEGFGARAVLQTTYELDVVKADSERLRGLLK